MKLQKEIKIGDQFMFLNEKYEVQETLTNKGKKNPLECEKLKDGTIHNFHRRVIVRNLI